MMMRFRGGGVGHTSTRDATDILKTDRDELDRRSQQARRDVITVEDEDISDEEMNGNEPARRSNLDIEAMIEGANVEDEGEIDWEGELSESESIDYRYEPEIESDEDEEEPEEEEDRDVGEEDDTAIDELAVLGYADY